jgi:hypothetical protein
MEDRDTREGKAIIRRIDVREWPAWKIALATNAANKMTEITGRPTPEYKAFRNVAERMIEGGELEYCGTHKRYYVPGYLTPTIYLLNLPRY